MSELCPCKDNEFDEINKVYEECLLYLAKINKYNPQDDNKITSIVIHNENYEQNQLSSCPKVHQEEQLDNSVENPAECLIYANCDLENYTLSDKLPKIIITRSDTNLKKRKSSEELLGQTPCRGTILNTFSNRLVLKNGFENVASISNIPFERLRFLNDTFHTLINLRWRWIILAIVLVYFALWFVFAVFWYITSMAHYDFEPNPPNRTCITGGKDFLTIFLASVEAQTTIGFGDRAIDEECPEAIFLFVMQLILGTGLSGVLTCIVYAKLTRPEKLPRDGVGFSSKAVISLRDGKLCLMMRAWDLNHDHIISSEISAYFINTYRSKEGEEIKYYFRKLNLQQRQFLLWPITLVHVIDATSPLFHYSPNNVNNASFEIIINLKGASASMGTFTQSQTSYKSDEVLWGRRFPNVVKYDCRRQQYVIDYEKLNTTVLVDTPQCSAKDFYRCTKDKPDSSPSGTPSSFNKKISLFNLERTSSFRHKTTGKFNKHD